MSFPEFLSYLRGPGINAVVGIAISFLVEYVPEWGKLTSLQKRMSVFGMCFVVPLLANLIGVIAGIFPAGFEASWWPTIVAGAAAFSASQVAHARKL